MSPRDLPVWGRVVAASMFAAAGWFAARSPALVRILGDSTVELSVAVVAVSFMIGMRVPPDLWPSTPRRPRFSLLVTLAVSLVAGGLILAAGATGLPRAFLADGKAAVPLIVAGACAWALAWGRTPQEGYGRWYGIATAAAVAPVAVGALASAVQGQMPPLALSTFMPIGTLFLFLAASGALVTQELAFRRLLVGQAGDAGLLVVVGAAAAFALWHLVIPTSGSAVQAAAGGMVNGLALGSLYVLSRSLLVCAWYHGVQVGLLRALNYQAAAILGQVGLGRGFWVGQLLAATVAAGILAYFVWRRNGVRGSILRAAQTPIAVIGDSDGTAAPVSGDEEVRDADGD